MRSRKPLLALAALFALQAGASGQIYAVTFSSEKAAKKVRNHLVTVGQEQVLVGEGWSGVKFDEDRGVINFASGTNKNEFVVPNPKDPGAEPYKFKGDERVPASKKYIVAIAGRDIARIRVYMRDETLSGLANEYRLKIAQIAEYEEELESVERGSGEWEALHVRLVSTLERLHQWLSSTCFSPAAEKLEKEIARQKKQVRGAALAERRERALASFKIVEPDEKLIELSQEISGGKDKFHVAETEHLRMFYIDEIADARVEEALVLGEKIIDDFRTSFVDPYVGDDFDDTIPDKLLQVWLYVPDNDKAFEEYSKGFWGVSWDQNREERLKIGGQRMGGSHAIPYRAFRRNRDLDLPAIVAHDMGHALAGYQYGKGAGNIDQDWLSEGVAYYVSFEFLGRNGVTCKAFDSQKAGYVKRVKKRDEGEKTVGVGRRDVLNEVALFKGRPIDQLALRDIFAMDDADLAKSWSFFDYVARKEGKAGQEWLRAAGTLSHDKNTFIVKWREKAAEILGVDAANAFRSVEERWREWATTGQETD